ncbi:37402_t:CDS:2 [Gigaspora margarita]|uniref:37402_t:CDS:1 n=1 Tax=Gigaspora margarita TaxID=4874 RepID=A0ABM8VWL8_GIGMA|nr:37402_t:CDS:2 [Gigaspora margarita]
MLSSSEKSINSLVNLLPYDHNSSADSATCIRSEIFKDKKNSDPNAFLVKKKTQ